MNRLATIGAIALAFVMIGSCKKGHSVDGYCQHLIALQCQFLYGCCNAAERETIDGYFELQGYYLDEDMCVEENIKELCAGMGDMIEAVDAERMTWDEDKMATCLTDVEEGANSCDAEQFIEALSDLGSADDGCSLYSDITQGLVKEGDTCYRSWECEDDEAACVEEEREPDDDPLISAKGICQSPPGKGDSCAEQSCASDYYCDSEEICQDKKANGEMCMAAYECKSGWCDWMAGECATLKANGEQCDYNQQCESGRCNSDDVCQAPQTQDIDYDICKPE